MPNSAIATAGDRFAHFAQTGDASLLDTLLAEHLNRAYAQALRFLGNKTDAEDTVQEAFIRVVRTAHRYDPSTPFAAWLGRFVHNTALEMLRSRRRRHRHEHEAGSLQTHCTQTAANDDGNHNNAALREAVLALPERYRAAVDLHYFAGLSQLDTARALGVSENAVAKCLQRAREFMRNLLVRRGVAISAVAIAGALESVPAHEAPALLHGKIALIRPTAAPASFAMGIVVTCKSVAGIIAAACLAFTGALWVRSQGVSSEAMPVKVWNFDDEAQMESLPPDPVRQYFDMHRWLPRGGVNDSGCVEVGSRQFAEGPLWGECFMLDTAIERLPILVTYDVQFAEAESRQPKQNAIWGPGAIVSWSKDGGCIRFDRSWPLRAEPATLQRMPWQHVTTFVNDQVICTQVDGRRWMVAVVDRLPDTKLCLALYGNLRIDNLVIHPATSRDCPDISDCLERAERAEKLTRPVFGWNILTSPMGGKGDKMTSFEPKHHVAAVPDSR
jgi:RNA polymerase sigma factor (sigma-70 family)